MVNQTAISAKIHVDTMWKLEQERQVSGVPRNKMLNEGARLYLDLADRRREFRLHTDPEIRKKIPAGFLRHWFPEVTASGIL